LVYALNIALV